MNNVITFDDLKFYSVSDGIEVYVCRGLNVDEFKKWYLKEIYGNENSDDYELNDFEELDPEYVATIKVRTDDPDECEPETFENALTLLRDRMIKGEKLPFLMWATEY